VAFDEGAMPYLETDFDRQSWEGGELKIFRVFLQGYESFRGFIWGSGGRRPSIWNVGLVLLARLCGGGFEIGELGGGRFFGGFRFQSITIDLLAIDFSATSKCLCSEALLRTA